MRNPPKYQEFLNKQQIMQVYIATLDPTTQYADEKPISGEMLQALFSESEKKWLALGCSEEARKASPLEFERLNALLNAIKNYAEKHQYRLLCAQST